MNMTVCTVLLILGAITLLFYIREKLRAYTLKCVFLKTAVSVLFIAVAICGWVASASSAGLQPFGAWIIMGLIFGLLGDIWLDLKYVYPKQDDPFTYAGFASFTVGHILFITGMLLRFAPQGKPMYVILPVLLAILVSGGNIVMENIMKLHFGKMKPIVFGYGAVLFSTVLISGSLAMYHGWNVMTLNLIFIGSILFALSDLVLSGTYFGGKERPIDIILNYLTYYPAQYLIALSLLFLQ